MDFSAKATLSFISNIILYLLLTFSIFLFNGRLKDEANLISLVPNNLSDTTFGWKEIQTKYEARKENKKGRGKIRNRTP